MNITAIDFETYYGDGFSLNRMTIPEYVHDPRFAVHGMAIAWPDGKAEFRSDVDEALVELRGRFGENLERTTVAGHNLLFDFYILNHVYGIRPRFFVDTMLLSYHVNGRRDGASGMSAGLGALAEHYGMQAKGSLEFMSGVRHPDVQQKAMLASYAVNDVRITIALAERLLGQITRPEVELPVLIHAVRLFTERSIRIDVDEIAHLENEVREVTAQALVTAGMTSDEISKDGPFTSALAGALARTDRRLPMKSGKNGLIPATAKKDPEMQAMLNDDDPVVAALANARINKKGQDQKLAKLDTLRRISTATGGFLPVHLAYHGSHTGRFAGGGGFNIQNLGTSGLGARIRNLLIPRPGNVFIIGDFAQIEARITAWFAGEQDVVRAFAENRDIYSEFASRVFGRSVRKPREDDPPETYRELRALRQTGKAAVLGLGFGMGALKFMNTMRADPDAARLFDSGQLSPEICRQVVKSYRQTYPGIPAFWRQLEDAARQAVNHAETESERVCFVRRDDVVKLRLPSSRELRYPNLRLDDTPRTIRFLDEFGSESEFTPDTPSLVYGKKAVLYGGALCENVAQATARDLLVEAILKLETAGLPVLFHVHDEVVLEVKQFEAAAAKERVEQIMSETPAWAKGLPIACEVKVADRYEK